MIDMASKFPLNCSFTCMDTERERKREREREHYTENCMYTLIPEKV